MRLARLPVSIIAATAAAVGLLPRAAVPASAPQVTRAEVGHPVLPFVADDYTKALAEARARKVPLFIEAWAPW